MTDDKLGVETVTTRGQRKEFERAMQAIWLELPESVARDFTRIVHGYVAELRDKPVDTPRCPICCADHIKAGRAKRGEKCPSCRLKHTDTCTCELCAVDAPKSDARTWRNKHVARVLVVQDEVKVMMYEPTRWVTLDELLEAYALPLRQAFQSQVEHTNFVRTEYQKRLAKAESESAALRLALKKVVQMAADHDSDGWSDEIQEFANAALEEK